VLKLDKQFNSLNYSLLPADFVDN